MITCEKCRAEFRADRNIGYPGHCDPPGSLVAYAALFLIAAGICFCVSLFALRSVMLALTGALVFGAIFSLVHIPEALRVCEQSCGGECPSCGHMNKITWYS